MKRVNLLAALCLATLTMPALAHHGWSSYDSENEIGLQGTFRSVSWTNPHGTATMSWRGQSWDVVLAPISRMEARGLSEEMIAPGQRIRIIGYPRRDGTREIRLERVMVGDRTVELR